MANSFKTTPPRSRNMRAIKSTNNRTTELKMRAHLAQSGIRGWKIRPANVPGCPDFLFSGPKLALFVDGCFWHGCPRCGHIPMTNVRYWRNKLQRNKARDRKIGRQLRSMGFRVVHLWECELREEPRRSVQRVALALERNR
jgi:DNA mismatch endonuclease, patch repair protein